MEKKFSLFKFLIITALFFIFLDLLIGKYIYKNFIRGDFIDTDLSVGIKHDVYDHTFKKSYKTNSAGWGPIRFTICTDPNGFRTNCENQYRELKKFDLAFMGDSNTEPVGINYENSFVGIIEKKLKNKKIANLAMASYSPAVHFAKMNSLLSEGYKFKEIIVFIDISDIRDEVVCYELDGAIVKRRADLSCLHLSPKIKERIFIKFKENFKLSFELYKIIQNNMIAIGIIELPIPNQVLNNPRSDWTHNYNKKYYNLMTPFFNILKKESFSNLYQKVYIKDDVHFNEEGNKIIAENFLNLYLE